MKAGWNMRRKAREIIFDVDVYTVRLLGRENRQMARLVRELSFQGTGTAFRLTGLHNVWDEQMAEQLRNKQFRLCGS